MVRGFPASTEARTEDHVYRIHKQAFAALLQHCDQAGARAFAARAVIKLSKRARNMGLEGGDVSVFYGVRQWSEDLESLDTLLSLANGAADEEKRIVESERERVDAEESAA